MKTHEDFVFITSSKPFDINNLNKSVVYHSILLQFCCTKGLPELSDISICIL